MMHAMQKVRKLRLLFQDRHLGALRHQGPFALPERMRQTFEGGWCEPLGLGSADLGELS